MPKHKSTAILASALLGLTACGTAGYTRTLSVSPEDAYLYIDGVKVESGGDARPYTFTFDEVQRHYVQAFHPDFKPKFEVVDQISIKKLIDSNLPLRITLQAR